MRHIMTATISGTRNGADWPAKGQTAPADLTEDELLHMVAVGHVRIAVDRPAEPVAPLVEISKPVAPELRARARRTKATT